MSPLSNVARARNLLGTFVEIRVSGDSQEHLHSAIHKAFAEIEKVHSLMSFHDPHSDISRLNLGAHRAPIQVDAWTYEVLESAQILSEATHGTFDVTVGQHLVEWDFLPRSHCTVVNGKGSYRDISLLPNSTVRFLQPLTIDLGGIAKGFAVDKAVLKLQEEGVPSGIVNAGGDLRVFGETQKIVLRVPEAPTSFLSEIELHNEALATSSALAGIKAYQQTVVSPLVRSGQGTAVTSAESISIRSQKCIIADGLTKIITQPEIDWQPVLRQFAATAYKIDNGLLFSTQSLHGS